MDAIFIVSTQFCFNRFGMFGYTFHAVNFERWRVIIAFKYRSG